MIKITSIEQANELASKGELIGVFEVPKEIYHKGPGLSCSNLKDIDESPAYYQWTLKNPKEMSRQMRLGDALHAKVLEPSTFSENVIVAGESGNTKAHQEAKKGNPDKNVITETDFAEMLQAADLLASKEFARKLLSGYHEYAFYWIDGETGILCKCKPDSLHRMGFIGDLKWSSATDEDHWMTISHDFKYQMQNAWYLDGVAESLRQSGQIIQGLEIPRKFYFVVVLSSAKIDVMYAQLPDDFIEDGRTRCRDALRTYKRCTEENYWPSKFEVFNEDTGKWVEAIRMVKTKPYMYLNKR